MEDTILHILSANGHENLVSTICTKDSSLLKARNLIEHANLEFGEAGLKELLRQKNCLGETALHEAARHGHGAVVSTLMAEDLELAGLVNNDSVSPLYLATARGSLHMVQNMVAKMLNHEITPAFYSGPKQQTALHAAVLQDPELTGEVVQLYPEPLGKGTDETRRTLHLVASTGNHKIAKLLLDKDRSLAYIKDSDGSFPVHAAVRMGHVKMIVLLLQRCPDSGQLLDGNGRNFLHIAMEAKNSYIIFKLLKKSKKKLSNSHWKKMFNKMLNTMDNNGDTPIHIAAEHGYNEFMESLSGGNELDMTLQNKEGLTAFDISVIQLRKSAGKTKNLQLICSFSFSFSKILNGALRRRDALGEFYIQQRGARFSTGLFQYYTKGQMSSETNLFRGAIQDHISATDPGGAKKKISSESLIAKAQLVGLGSVLIVTVTFAAVFSPPGSDYPDTYYSQAILRVFALRAFVAADCLAFFLSMLSTLVLIYSSNEENPDWMESHIAMSMNLFTIAAKCMVVALVSESIQYGATCEGVQVEKTTTEAHSRWS
ncbi:Ankyrin repeat-containing protein [Carex littledalei]|uniref:Ankyrin repeat-containing protein n=1 Tax=Carex littledalei TaxID=544730 RepID=A0A833RFT1_9POAL|nr:Ankyrin repeat-containing protein [Carex littledalei]